MIKKIIALALSLLVAAANVYGTSVNVDFWMFGRSFIYESTTGTSTDAAGESLATIGHLWLPAQTGSKTCSSAGCTIYWNSAGGNVFSNAGSNLRIGLQDVTTATGVEDGTFDVQADWVGGTDPITDSLLQTVPMESGTKTVTHGDLIAIAFELTTRGGSDLASVDRVTGTTESSRAWGMSFGYPYNTVDTGSGPVKDTLYGPSLTMIKFDDGTYGWIHGVPLITNVAAGRTSIGYNSGSTPDEHIAAFQVPFAGKISGFAMSVLNIATADTFEMILYSDPFGTPVAERTWAPDPDGLITDGWLRPLVAQYTIAANTWYGVALRPTSANNISFPYYNSATGYNILKIGSPFTQIKMAARTNQTGAFTETQTYHVPDFAVHFGAIDDGAGSGGGGATSFPFAR